jgi:hypothetical protein
MENKNYRQAYILATEELYGTAADLVLGPLLQAYPEEDNG